MSNQITRKKELGIYYTPTDLSDALCELTIDQQDYKILEPSFGGCAFLDSISKRLKTLGHTESHKNIYGCDIDEAAFLHLKKWGVNGTIDQYLQTDFLKTDSNSFGDNKFDLVIGNPPYVSVHNMNDKQREFLNNYWNEEGLSFTKKASLWAYFIIHSLKFLKEGGKICFILPSIAGQNYYGKEALNHISKHFNKLDWHLLDNEFFIHEGIEEKVGVLIGEGYSESINPRPNRINNYSATKEIFYDFCKSKKDSDLLLDIRSDKNSIYNLFQEDKFIKLSDLLDIKIGAVTGDNRFFILNRSQINTIGIDPGYFKPVIRRFGDLNGFEIRKKDFNKLNQLDKRVWLLSTDKREAIDSDLHEYLQSYDNELIDKNKTFAKNENWWEFPLGQIPEAFFSYMSKWGASLIINTIKANCTNSVHKVFFKEKHTKKEMLLVSIALQSSYGQLSSELEARIYSSSVLKFEPTASKNIRIPNTKPYTDKIELKEVNNWIRNNLNTSRDVMNLKADEFLIEKGIITGENISKVRNTLKHLRKKRNPNLSD